MSIDVLTIDYTDPDASVQFENSLKSSGFAVIKNHPIDQDLVQSVYTDWKSFFNNENKYDLLFDKDKQDGYFPYLTENAKDS
ncbi:MAG: 2-oxoglutarate and iron-dependent oxygenase domain-containing protein, partial [Candidatus Marinimicrobia bacterium]|nr:2-oxoglutarate and iron-dependent oxygenase domain-containing protein [Candidatus Neomarinimicrobiota bacterium]